LPEAAEVGFDRLLECKAYAENLLHSSHQQHEALLHTRFGVVDWCFNRVSHSFTDKKTSRTFPGLSRTPMKNFPGPFWSPRMFKYKEKTEFTYNIQSAVHCRKFNMKQNVI